MNGAAFVAAEWRVGRKVGRTIYAYEGVPTDHDTLIGVMDTRELAESVVRDHNAARAARLSKRRQPR